MALKNEIADNLVTIAIILSLPTSFSTLQMILMSLNDQSTEDVTAKILAEESCRQETAAQSAFSAKFRPGNKSGKDGSKDKENGREKKKCNMCGKHHTGECQKKAGQKDDKPKDNKAKGNAMAKVALYTSYCSRG
jgi:hypothetical protein